MLVEDATASVAVDVVTVELCDVGEFSRCACLSLGRVGVFAGNLSSRSHLGGMRTPCGNTLTSVLTGSYNTHTKGQAARIIRLVVLVLL